MSWESVRSHDRASTQWWDLEPGENCQPISLLVAPWLIRGSTGSTLQRWSCVEERFQCDIVIRALAFTNVTFYGDEDDGRAG